MENFKFGFIGAGNMASAIINGILSLGYIKPEHIYIYDCDRQKRDNMSKYGINIVGSNIDVVNAADFVFLCVKPQTADTVFDEITPFADSEKCVVSIMAGITTGYIKSRLGDQTKIVRVMPNTPLMVGWGAAALVKLPEVPDRHFDVVKGIFEASGKAVVVSEDQLSAVTAVSGSGPAYFFKFAGAALEEAKELGLDDGTALTLLTQTMIGSAEMLRKSGMTAKELLRMVTSPNGTTQAANEVFDANHFESTIKKAMKACHDRSVELGGKQ